MYIRRSKERKRLRWNRWNYSNVAYYFVTICIKNRHCVFGDIKNGFMGLNEYGIIANKNWLDIPNHFDGVELDDFVVMPNHVHGIVSIYEPYFSGTENSVRVYNGNNGGGCIRVGDRHAYPLPEKYKPRNTEKLPNIIGSFKSSVTKIINQLKPNINFYWQRSYYDRIIRNERELNRIRQYIRNNPIKWEMDRNNPENLFM